MTLLVIFPWIEAIVAFRFSEVSMIPQKSLCSFVLFALALRRLCDQSVKSPRFHFLVPVAPSALVEPGGDRAGDTNFGC